MPIYEYRCQQCNRVFSHLFRTLRAAEEEGAPPCPACGAREVRRIVSPVAVLSGSKTSAGEQAEKTATESRPQLFGRKELNQILQERKRLGID